MKKRHRIPSPVRSAFTLIELLVVIAIIAILGAMMYPAITTVMKKMKITRAETTIQGLRQAIDTYVTEYRKLPVRDQSLAGAELLLLSNQELMNVLCGSDSETGEGGLNHRRTVFFSGRTARPLGVGRYHSGVRIDADGSAELFDPWGEHYRILLDTDADARIARPSWDDRTTSAAILEPVLIWSAGPDLEPQSMEDNVASW